MASRDHAPATCGASHQQVPALCCDLCDWPMALPEPAASTGKILGLLTCSLCIEDALAIRTLEMQP
jgi:hypothetical protein